MFNNNGHGGHNRVVTHCRANFLLHRDVESIDFSFDSQLPSSNNRQTPDSTSLSRKIFRSTPNFQLSVPKIVWESNSQAPKIAEPLTPNRLHIPAVHTYYLSKINLISFFLPSDNNILRWTLLQMFQT